MKEDFLYYIWKNQLFNFQELKDTQGAPLEVIHTGIRNGDSGPDFLHAKIKIEDILWSGSVEIHVKTSDWIKHAHQNDEAYKNVVLHVVFEHDIDISNKETRINNTLALQSLISPDIIANYKHLMKNDAWIPCEKKIHKIDPFSIRLQIERMMIGRLQRKSTEIADELKLQTNDWNQTFFIFLFKAFGFKTNASAFELLGRSIPYIILEKNNKNRFFIEALLYGQAGFLEGDCANEYFTRLKKEYAFMQKKYALNPVHKSVFKFSKTRPDNFPTIRISQLAHFLSLFDRTYISQLIENQLSKTELTRFFDVAASAYWDDHYQFEKPSKKGKKRMGSGSIEKILINLLIPFKFAYAQFYKNDALKEEALNLLMDLKPENNSVVQKWKEKGINIQNAFDSQALLELKNEWCNHKKCVSCNIGHKILKNNYIK